MVAVKYKGNGNFNEILISIIMDYTGYIFSFKMLYDRNYESFKSCHATYRQNSLSFISTYENDRRMNNWNVFKIQQQEQMLHTKEYTHMQLKVFAEDHLTL